MKGLIRYALPISILLAIAVLGCGSDSESPDGSSADVTINIVGQNGGNSFSPNPANVKVGQTVSWHNGDNTTHTATQNSSGFNTGNIASGATSAPIQINTAGDLGYHCTLHPTMVGTLHVTP